ncbi:MAG: ribosome biogenesis GTP-binding protein YihA/YsxC [Spirochaetaceae bacterium]|nr:ribosome biogenesis GTP-binding protein YihA/YsxC [Spirochaetaceae bacterium]
MLNFDQVRFSQSCPFYHQLPADELPEVAFAGRSNAGKSSLINNLCRQHGLAKASGVPGKTREMNLFNLCDDKNLIARLVDLPGYGYAKASHSLQQQWQAELTRYLMERPNLKLLILIMDCRHPLTENDQLTINLAAKRNLRQILIFNKIDKLNQSGKAGLKKVISEAEAAWPNVQAISYSSTKNIGKTALADLIEGELRE